MATESDYRLDKLVYLFRTQARSSSYVESICGTRYVCPKIEFAFTEADAICLGMERLGIWQIHGDCTVYDPRPFYHTRI